jgi:hypothetical protein
VSESDLTEILNHYYTNGLKLSTITYVAITLVSFIAGVFGTYLSSYSKKSGELRAINAKFEETQEQLKKQTHSIEEIRADISNRIWIEQKKWEFKKDIYLNLIDLLVKIKNECSRAEVYLNRIQKNLYLEDDAEFEKMKDSLIAEAEKIYFGVVDELTNELKIMLSKTGLLFLDQEVIDSLYEYFKAEEIRIQNAEKKFTQDYKAGNVTLDDSGSIDNYVESLYYKSKAAKNAYEILIRFAKYELKINN